jgi:hypothetical protein
MMQAVAVIRARRMRRKGSVSIMDDDGTLFSSRRKWATWSERASVA